LFLHLFKGILLLQFHLLLLIFPLTLQTRLEKTGGDLTASGNTGSAKYSTRGDGLDVGFKINELHITEA